LEDVFIVQEDFGFLPRDLVSVTFTDVFSTLELKDVEKSLPNSWEFDDVDISKVSNLLLPLLWYKRSIDTTSSSN